MSVVVRTPLNAEGFNSGAASDGMVLTADGAGKALWEAASGGGGVTDVTYAELVALIGSAGLMAGGWYRITDYATTHYIVDGNGNTYETLVAQVDTVTLTGTAGTANVTGAGGLTKLATFASDLETTAHNFVTDHAAAYLTEHIVVTHAGADLIFTAEVAGTGFDRPVITNVSDDLAGTAVHTTGNDNPIIVGTTEPLLCLATDVDVIDSRVYSALHPEDIIHYDWNPAHWVLDQAFGGSAGEAIIDRFKGVITFRHDTLLDNYAGFDWRECKFRRWKTAANAWDANTGYSAGAIVNYGGTNGGVYKSLIAIPTPETPNTDPATDTTRWIKMLDLADVEYWNARPGSFNSIPTADSEFIDVHMFAEGEGTATYEICCRANHFEPFKDTQDMWDTYTASILSNNVVWLADEGYYTFYSNEFGPECQNNTFGAGCRYNTFGAYCYSNTFGAGCGSNTFGAGCYSNTFGASCTYNTFGAYCRYNTFGADYYSNTFGAYCYSNTFGAGCGSNTFGAGCASNTFGAYCYSNTFGAGCRSNTFGEICYSNTFGAGCGSSTFGANAGHNKIVDGGSANLDFTSATHVYAAYSCEIFLDAGGTSRLRYYDASGVEQVVLATA